MTNQRVKHLQKLKYTQYESVVNPIGAEVGVIVQIPEDAGDKQSIQVMIRSGNRMLNLALVEFEAISEVISEALVADGWEPEKGGS